LNLLLPAPGHGIRKGLLALALSAAGPAAVRVAVVPGTVHVRGGATVQLQWQLAGTPEELQRGCYWAWSGPDQGAVLVSAGWDTAAVTVPATDRRLQLRVQAIHKADGRCRGSAAITVLPGPERAPAAPGPVAPAILDFQPLVTHWNRVPFLNLAPGPVLRGAPFGSGRSPEPLPERLAAERYLAGYGRPVTLRWLRPPGEVASMLSLDEGDRVRHRNVTGQDSQEITVRDTACKAVVECFSRTEGRQLRRVLHAFPVATRALLPFAGAGPGAPDQLQTWDERGAMARFAAPCGVALVGPTPYDQGAPPPAGRPKLVLADPQAHVLRCLQFEGSRGTVATCWGQVGNPGYREGALRAAQFREPSFLLSPPEHGGSGPDPAPDAGFLVSDSGNHVLRWVDAQGATRPLAGKGEQPGYQNGPLLEARFDHPQGLAMDSGGRIYVADQGNCVIRTVDLEAGRVSTLAGRPGVPGGEDGPPGTATFLRVQGLACGSAPGGARCLYVADGNSVRRIALEARDGVPAGTVTTVLGGPALAGALAGSRDAPAMAEGPARMAGLPCLDQPVGLAAWNHMLFIADRGNHAVRVYDTLTGHLFTLAGDRELPLLRPGLLRDDRPGPLPEAYGALPAPAGLWLDRTTGDLVVTARQCVVRILSPAWLPFRLVHRAALATRPATPEGRPFTLEQVLLVAEPRPAEAGNRCAHQARFEYQMALFDPDGACAAAPVLGTGSLDVALPPFTGTFTRPGTWAAVLTVVLETGHTLRWTLSLEGAAGGPG
jgi:hypothetical protein